MKIIQHVYTEMVDLTLILQHTVNLLNKFNASRYFEALDVPINMYCIAGKTFKILSCPLTIKTLRTIDHGMRTVYLLIKKM
jgi:hypothetical protein